MRTPENFIHSKTKKERVANEIIKPAGKKDGPYQPHRNGLPRVHKGDDHRRDRESRKEAPIAPMLGEVAFDKEIIEPNVVEHQNTEL